MLLLALANNKDYMPRKLCPKTVRSIPLVRAFTPYESDPGTAQDGIILLLEEWEALRLVDYAGFEQVQAALSMGISRQSVQMLLSSARSKLARAVVEGLPLSIQGDPEKTEEKNRPLFKRNLLMKIAVTTQHTQVFPHFGRTPEFYIATAEDGKIVEENIVPAPAEGHGALVGFLISQSVDTLICGGVGGGAVNSLRAAGIQVYAGAAGPVKDQVLSLLGGQLPQHGEANCENHEEHNHNHGSHGCDHN
jgi:predicted DNA-binding protein (UPF0251 family)/predicted Fe-Mo cluster-binding NifX family protein